MGSCDPVESDEVVSFASPVISSDDDQDITEEMINKRLSFVCPRMLCERPHTHIERLADTML